MAKKDFDKINTSSRVFSNLEQSTSGRGKQSTASQAEQEERKRAHRTQGRKGCKLDRFNMGFTPENREFIKIMAKLKGQTMTDFVNDVIEQYRNENNDVYEQARELIGKL